MFIDLIDLLFQTSQDPSSPLVGTSSQLSASLNITSGDPANLGGDIRDGWENDEWASLEEEAELEEKANNIGNNHIEASRSNSNSNSNSVTNNNHNNSPAKMINDHSKTNANTNWEKSETTWGLDDEFEPIDDGPSNGE